jgi:hypothetical protein
VRTLYASGRAGRVWALLLVSAACAVGAVGVGVDLGRTYGLRPADGGVLKPLPVRLAWAGGVASLGLGFFGGMLVYGACYVTRLALDAEGRAVLVRTLLRTRTIPVAEVAGGAYHAGRTALRQQVNAPWQSLRVRGRRLPYVLDVQGEVRDAEALGRLARGKLPGARRPAG